MWCLDDRGRKVEVQQQIVPEKNKLLGGVMSSRDWGLYRGAAFAAVLATVVIFVPLLFLTAEVPGPNDLYRALTFGAACVFCAVLMRFFLARQFARTLAARFRAARTCACCAYNLTGCPRDDDGCTVCPECGAAWKLPDVAGVDREPPVE